MTPEPVVVVDPVLVLAETDFAVGGVSFVSESLEVSSPVFATTGDPLVRAIDGRVYVVERGGADVISALDPASPQTPIWQTALPAGANVHDVVSLDGLLWLPAYDLPEVFAVDPADGTLVHRLDLSAYADADGLPELDRAVVLDGLLFVAAQRLQRDSGFVSDGGLLVVVDPRGPEVDRVIEVGPNPRIVGQGQGIWVATGLFATPTTPARLTDGALHWFDGDTLEAFTTEEEREADLWQVVPAGDHTVLLEILDDGSSRIACMDGAEVTDGPTDEAWFITGALLPDGSVVVGARTGLLGAQPTQRGLSRVQPDACSIDPSFSTTTLDPYDLSAL